MPKDKLKISEDLRINLPLLNKIWQDENMYFVLKSRYSLQNVIEVESREK